MHPILESLQKSLGINLRSESDLEEIKRTYSVNTYSQDETGEVTGLNLCNGNWTDAQLRELWRLPGLRVVQLCGNKLEKLIIPDSLEHLEWLDLSDNKNLQHLEFSGDSTQLVYLDVSDSALQELIFPKTAGKLERLDAARNRIETISLPEELPVLERLDLGSNKLSNFIFPSGSTRLSQVFLDKNELKEIAFPDHQSDYLPDNLHLRLDENALSDDLRANIIDRSNAFPFIRQWLADTRVATDEDKDYKVLVLGNGGVGKSSLIDRMVDNTFEENRPSTHAIRLVRFENSRFPYVLNFWDFGGQDIYHATHRIFLQTNAVYLLLWDKETEDKALKGEPTIFIEDEQKREYINESLAYWMHYAQFFGKGSPVIVVQTKTTKHGGHKLECPGKSDLLKIHDGKFLEFIHIDAGIDHYTNGFKSLALNLEDAILSIAREGQKPASWLALRKYFTNQQEAIQKARERNEESELDKTLTIDAFEVLVKNFKINTDSKYVLNWLKETGVLFHREGMFNDRIILDQEWAIRAIYTIFSRGKGGAYYQLLSQQGRFTGADLAKIWDKFETPEQQLFLDFMLTCELCSFPLS
ncbi:MAG TPA: COR domain-containing protein [Flavilitoribacter sp.]|nr:COR domain-containing protein [Flavilitoribacter sp.]HMQ91288.1 COR domain-containing protein [Flavilitoribacter sp.]